ncbi:MULTISPECIES: squalene monooxygenase [unclassified Bradyrhizobium]|uniref:squalene monooxygenase n=1 Tax=unclassified Bradyrhizobium TaxID=2631580 RepID=UPI001BA8C77B|nr:MULTISPECIES: squalene monooxygenase [unclassified Bradyrhizobium]MBR1208877.1 squalene monooxygenase [Bradyrhizobium sp. AUGA SZCCT0124]MBR1317045.1 squalene monooxygenase [Bradyrhizobium sp. AUGA SZCCT0051]MBR1345221.1 squalene monooxygenase [Bradyrhizobium sp. AUGA SZCCT0105]MBR1360288.1 squalene monooxygenase [Bradyrhizobium sp. AUGA SZCCT0045]
MPKSIGRHAIVVGAGMAGLAAAKALSSFFDAVTVLERDALPSAPIARSGTPQARQIHVLLKGGLDALSELMPDFETELERAGAVRVRVGSQSLLEFPGFDPFPRRDLAFDYLSMTRPLLELVARRLVQRDSTITLNQHCRVTEFLQAPGRDGVAGVRYEHGNASHELAADLVVDASSRGALTLDFLVRIGLPRPKETEIGIDLRYATAMFEIPSDAPPDWRTVLHRPSLGNCRGGLLVPVENNCWQVNLTTLHGEPVPENVAEFIAFARTMRTQTIHDAIARARPVGPIYRFGFPCSIRRHFEALERFPSRLLPLGDVICRFNPAFGQGMSVAAQQAGALRWLIEARIPNADPLAGIAWPFFEVVQDFLAAPWATAESDFIHEKTRGQCPHDFKERLNFNSGLLRLASEDATVHRTMSEVSHLVKPSSALRAPEIVNRVSALLAVSI